MTLGCLNVTITANASFPFSFTPAAEGAFAVLSVARAKIIGITRADVGVVEVTAQVEGEATTRRAVAYPALTGQVTVGDTVTLNITATGLGLGTGGVDFVVQVEGYLQPAVYGDPDGSEHIIKLRYTPLQHAVAAVEMDPAYRSIWETESTLRQTPVVVCELHSQIACVAAGVKAAAPHARIVYVMTDEGALPLAFSALVRDLKAANLLDATITTGQAFGGDYEAVTVPSALLAARWIAGADVVVVGQGPGNAGTNTRFGFGGMMQGIYLDLAGRLQGTPIGVLRLSLSDRRDRHHGLSHHSVTALGLIAQSPAMVAFPSRQEEVPMTGADYQQVRDAVMASPVARLHTIEEADGLPGLSLLEERGLRVTSMGRGIREDSVFFHAAAAAGALAARHVVSRTSLPPSLREEQPTSISTEMPS